jgi:hypothetical protein
MEQSPIRGSSEALDISDFGAISRLRGPVDYSTPTASKVREK